MQPKNEREATRHATGGQRPTCVCVFLRYLIQPYQRAIVSYLGHHPQLPPHPSEHEPKVGSTDHNDENRDANGRRSGLRLFFLLRRC